MNIPPVDNSPFSFPTIVIIILLLGLVIASLVEFLGN